MGGPFGRKTTAELLADQVSRQLRSFEVPWVKDISSNLLEAPRNLVSEYRYQGASRMILSLRNYKDPRWLTFEQAKNRNGWVRKGETATKVVFWEGEGRNVRMRTFPLFNYEQCAGLGGEKYTLEYRRDWKRWDQDDRLTMMLEGTGLRVAHDQHPEAEDNGFFRRSTETFHLPPAGNEPYQAAAARALCEWAIGAVGEEFRGDEREASFVKALGSYMLAQELSSRHDGSRYRVEEKGWIELMGEDPKNILLVAGKSEAVLDKVLEAEQIRKQERYSGKGVNREGRNGKGGDLER